MLLHILVCLTLKGTQSGNKCQLMARSLLREVTEPAVFVSEVAKQHDVFVRAIASRVFVSARTSFCLDATTRKLFECFNDDLPKLTQVPPTAQVIPNFQVLKWYCNSQRTGHPVRAQGKTSASQAWYVHSCKYVTVGTVAFGNQTVLCLLQNKVSINM